MIGPFADLEVIAETLRQRKLAEAQAEKADEYTGGAWPRAHLRAPQNAWSVALDAAVAAHRGVAAIHQGPSISNISIKSDR